MNLPQRLKDARARLGLKQDEVAAQSGVSYSVYQKYELGRSVPGGEAIAGLVRLGINANWLLTGEGPMMLADLVAPAPAAAPLIINVDALVQAFCVSLQTAPKGESPEKSARKAVEFYLYCVERGLITPEGQGEGSDAAAA